VKNKASIQFQGTSFDKYSIACMYVFMEQNKPSKLKLYSNEIFHVECTNKLACNNAYNQEIWCGRSWVRAQIESNQGL
jgi:hypothetical protein